MKKKLVIGIIILITVIILIIASLLYYYDIINISKPYSNGLSNEYFPPDINEQIASRIKKGCYDEGKCKYCSTANGCPTDKCILRVGCSGGALCLATLEGCDYKDPALKENYSEITFKQAKKCALRYIQKNEDDLLIFENFNFLKGLSFSGPTEYCYETFYDSVEDQEKYKINNDLRCYLFRGETYIISPMTYEIDIDLYVGAQSCAVYKDEWLKDPDLSEYIINYSSEEAKNCALKYITNNPDNLFVFAHFDPSKFHIDEEAHNSGYVVDQSKDAKFYTVSGQTKPIPPTNYKERYYFAVGAQTCTVYYEYADSARKIE